MLREYMCLERGTPEAPFGSRTPEMDSNQTYIVGETVWCSLVIAGVIVPFGGLWRAGKPTTLVQKASPTRGPN